MDRRTEIKKAEQPSAGPIARPSAQDVARVAQLVERILGKDEVRGSIPRASLVE